MGRKEKQIRIPTFNKKQKELLADLWDLDEYERKEIAMFLIASTLNPGSHSMVYSKVKKFDKIDLEMMKNYRGPTIKEREEMGL